MSGGGFTPAAGDWSSLETVGGGASAGASFFRLEARGREFVYVVDRSGSMSGDKLRAAKNELIRSVSSLKRAMRFFIIFYDTHPMPSRGLVKATESNKRRCFAWVGEVRSGGGTDPTGAMRIALSLRPDAVWLLSDGIFSVRACDEIRVANPGARVQIHTVAFYDKAGERVLMRIAEENRGRYRFVPPQAIFGGRFP